MHWLEWALFGGFMWFFLGLPLWSTVTDEFNARKRERLGQRDQDLAWWIQESGNAESPFYRHVCEDMVAYLRDMDAREPHPSFKDRVRVVKPGQRPKPPSGPGTTNNRPLTKEDLDYLRGVYGR